MGIPVGASTTAVLYSAPMNFESDSEMQGLRAQKREREDEQEYNREQTRELKRRALGEKVKLKPRKEPLLDLDFDDGIPASDSQKLAIAPPETETIESAQPRQVDLPLGAPKLNRREKSRRSGAEKDSQKLVTTALSDAEKVESVQPSQIDLPPQEPKLSRREKKRQSGVGKDLPELAPALPDTEKIESAQPSKIDLPPQAPKLSWREKKRLNEQATEPGQTLETTKLTEEPSRPSVGEVTETRDAASTNERSASKQSLDASRPGARSTGRSLRRLRGKKQSPKPLEKSEMKSVPLGSDKENRSTDKIEQTKSKSGRRKAKIRARRRREQQEEEQAALAAQLQA